MSHIIELPGNQYLGTMSIVDNIEYAEVFDDQTDAQDRADMYNADNDHSGKILARIRTVS